MGAPLPVRPILSQPKGFLADIRHLSVQMKRPIPEPYPRRVPMFTRYLIAACLQTTHEVIRLAENGITLETAAQVTDLAQQGVFWTLYGRLEDGRSLAVSDCTTLQGALDVYAHITGCKAPQLPADALLVDLYAPNPKNLLDVGAELALQVEQMKDMFDDADGTIEKALEDFEEAQREFDSANTVDVASAPSGLFPLVTSLYEAQGTQDGQVAAAALDTGLQLGLKVDTRRVIGEGSQLFIGLGNFPGEDEQFSFLVRAESEEAARQQFTAVALSEFGQNQDIEANVRETGNPCSSTGWKPSVKS